MQKSARLTKTRRTTPAAIMLPLLAFTAAASASSPAAPVWTLASESNVTPPRHVSLFDPLGRSPLHILALPRRTPEHCGPTNSPAALT